MSPEDAAAFQDFSRWLTELPADARVLSRLVVDPVQPSEARAYAAGALGVVLHASDLVCNGLEDLAWIEVALLLRIAARQARAAEIPLGEGEGASLIERLASEADAAARFLGDLGSAFEEGCAPRLFKVVRHRGVEATLAEPELGAALAVDVATWATDYTPPALTQDKYELVKLRTFLRARLAQSSD